MTARTWVCAIAVVLFATGCAGLPQRPPVADPAKAWHAHQAELQDVDQWDIDGSLAVHTREKSGQASIVWSRHGDSNRINLFGPFGAGSVILTQDAGGAHLQDSKHHYYSAADARSLLYRTIGWDVPFEDLKYWVLGLPAPGASRELVLDPWGRLASLQQQGWEVNIPEYGRQDGRELPRRIDLRRLPGGSGANNGARVRLVIHQWGLKP